MNIGSKISHKLILVVIIPLLGMALFSFKIAINELDIYNNKSKLQELIFLTNKASDLVHEFQKERGMTAGFLGSKGKSFVAEIKAQREKANIKLNDYKTYTQNFDASSLPPQITDKISKITKQLTALNDIRFAVDQLTIQTPKAIEYYTQNNTLLLSLISQLAGQSDNANLAVMAAAFENFLQSKERAGIERAVLSNTFSRNNFAPGMERKFKTLVNEQNTYLSVFMAYASDDQKTFFERTVAGEMIQEVEKMRTVASDKAATGNFGIDASHWFQTITKKINALKEVEEFIINELTTYCTQLIQTAKNTLLLSVLLTLVGLFISIALCFHVIRGIINPTKQLHNTIEYVENSHDLVTRIDTKSNDEIGQMANALNRMFDAFQTIISQVNQDTLQIASASQQLANVTERNSAEIDLQHRETESLATAMNEMVATAREIANHAQRAADAANEANLESEEGRNTVTATISSIQALAQEIDSASHVVEKVEQDSLEIGGILDVIRDIAEQTNLLALNAAIEAARAGEQGRGFAVVADEVRTLAFRTQESTQDIQNMIEKLQNETKSAVNIMSNSQKQAIANVTQAQKAGQSLETITQSVSIINDMNIQIASAAEEQTAVSDEINRNVINIKNSADHTLSGASEITSASENLDRLSHELSSLVKQFKV